MEQGAEENLEQRVAAAAAEFSAPIMDEIKAGGGRTELGDAARDSLLATLLDMHINKMKSRLKAGDLHQPEMQQLLETYTAMCFQSGSLYGQVHLRSPSYQDAHADFQYKLIGIPAQRVYDQTVANVSKLAQEGVNIKPYLLLTDYMDHMKPRLQT